MKLFKWEPGRQPGCPYRKLCFLRLSVGRYGFDGYILRFDPHGSLLVHTDRVEYGKHYRLNLVLKGKVELKTIRKPFFNCFNKIIFFRPDIIPHGLMVFDKPAWILSLGFRRP